MIQLRSFDSLGRFRNDWLNARHHFSFGQYHDPARTQLGILRVWNDDEVAPGAGFDPHPHRDMEIITYIRDGAITHRDDLGNEGRTDAGDVQVMHAGAGITHAEYNMGKIPTRLFQIWIKPDRRGVQPGWATRAFPKAEGLFVLASGRKLDADTGALPLYADAAVLAARLQPGRSTELTLGAGRVAYVVPVTGAVTIKGTDTAIRDGVRAAARDGVAISDEASIVITAQEATELVVVEAAATETRTA